MVLKNNENTGLKLNNKEAIKRINLVCKEKEMGFIGFDNIENEYKNDKTILNLRCLKCGLEFNFPYGKFVRVGRQCPNCRTNKPLTKEKMINDINEICKERDYTFLGFKSELTNKGQNKLILQCNKCGKIWDTTTFSNFKKIDRNSHTCYRKFTYHQGIKHNDEFYLKRMQEENTNKNIEILEYIPNESLKSIGHVKVRCKRCGEIFLFSISTYKSNGKKITCKNCDRFKRRSKEENEKLILEICKENNLTFVGFKNEYKNSKSKIIIQCNKCGKIMDKLSITRFLREKTECFNCNPKHKKEIEIEKILKENKIEYETQKTFEWLKNNIKLRLDFYLPKYNIAIECQGIQHFEPHNFGNKEDKEKYKKAFQIQQINDKIKYEKCVANNIKLLYFSNQHKYSTFLNQPLIENKEKLIEEIKKYGKES